MGAGVYLGVLGRFGTRQWWYLDNIVNVLKATLKWLILRYVNFILIV